MTRLSKIIIVMIVLMTITSGIVIFMADSVSEYGIQNYDDSDYKIYNQTGFTDLTSKIEEFEQNKSNVDQDNEGDVLGALFSSVYVSAETIKGTGSVANNMVGAAVDQLPTGNAYKSVLKTNIGLIVVVVFVIFLFMAFVIKNERV